MQGAEAWSRKSGMPACLQLHILFGSLFPHREYLAASWIHSLWWITVVPYIFEMGAYSRRFERFPVLYMFDLQT
ncbi:unnamed protein product [Urochloa humidicola]